MVSCGGGIVTDVRARLPLYYDDWVVGFDRRALAAGIWIFFSQAIPATTFASFLASRTDGEVGVIETLVSMALGGVLFALCAGQPLVVVGVTGPICILIASIYDLAISWGLPFRGWLFWACAWAAAMHAVLASVSAPRAFLRYTTAFSGDVFGALIGSLYIYEGVRALVDPFSGVGSGADAAALLAPVLASFLLGILCWALASILDGARAWRALPAAARGLLADYSLPLAVIIAAASQFSPALAPVRDQLPLLPVPSTLAPTAARPWVDGAAIASVPGWGIAAAALPGAMITALLFFDHNVSAMLSQEPRFGLKKPGSYDYDFLLLGVMTGLCGLLGIPPLYGLLPQAPLHVRALATIEARANGGEVWLSVCETRVSALLQSALLCALLAPPLLALLGSVPVGVLAGVFVHLGLGGLANNGAVERVRWALLGWEGQPSAAAAEPHGPPLPLSQAETPAPQPFEGGGGLSPLAAPHPRERGSGLSLLAVARALAVLQVALVGGIFAVTLTNVGFMFPVLIVLLLPLRLYVLPYALGAGALEAADPRDRGASTFKSAAVEAQEGAGVTRDL